MLLLPWRAKGEFPHGVASPGSETVRELPEHSEHGSRVGVALLGGRIGERIAQAIDGLDKVAWVGGFRQQVGPEGAELGVEIGEEGGV